MNIKEFTREEILDNYNQIIDILNTYQSILTRVNNQPNPRDDIYIKISSLPDNVNFVKNLKSYFDLNQTLSKIIVIDVIALSLSQYTNNLYMYLLLIGNNNLNIHTISNNWQVNIYNFTYPIENYDDYDSVDFIKAMHGSRFDIFKGNRKRLYLTIYRYWKESIEDPVLEDSKANLMLDKELKCDMLFNYLYYLPDKVNDYVEKNKHDISLLINIINLVYNSNTSKDLFEYSDLISNWISDYLNWYNDIGKEKYQKLKCLLIVEGEYDMDLINHSWNDMLLSDINNENFHFIKKHGIYAVVPSYYELDIKVLIKQLYYRLAQQYISGGVLNDEDKKNLLDYLEKADDYLDAKELKNKLFYEYTGLQFGKDYDINLDDLRISALYDLTKILNNNK